MKTKKIIYPIFFIVLLFISCTKLNETFTGSTGDVYSLSIEQIVAPAYSNLYHLWCQGETTNAAVAPSEGGLFPIQELSSDEAMIPTRKTDWYDGGKWQQDYLLTWTPNHDHIKQLYVELSEGIARANGSLLSLDKLSQTSAVKTYQAELHFLRCYYSYLMMDIYGQVPYREYNEIDFLKDPQILDRKSAFDKIVSELKNIALPGMADYNKIPYGRPTKDACKMLLAKLYLNEEVYTGVSGYKDCLTYLNDIISSHHYAIADDYWKIFAPDNNINNNGNANSELIFVGVQKEVNNPAVLGNSGKWDRPFMLAFGYNHKWSQNVPPVGGTNINGVVAPEDFCIMICAHTDTLKDMRWRDDRFVGHRNYIYLGFNYGQQYNFTSFDPKAIDSTRKLARTRSGKPLIYTFDCPLLNATENNGVRVLKFYPNTPDLPIEQTSFGESYSNDYPIFRIADAYLMRAECNLRLGTSDGAAPVEDINAIRFKRNKNKDNSMNVTAGDVTPDFILAERGIELYQEMHRRQDLIRFGKFLGPKASKTETSPASRLLCPIPQPQIDIIKNLKQNPGY